MKVIKHNEVRPNRDTRIGKLVDLENFEAAAQAACPRHELFVCAGEIYVRGNADARKAVVWFTEGWLAREETA